MNKRPVAMIRLTIYLRSVCIAAAMLLFQTPTHSAGAQDVPAAAPVNYRYWTTNWSFNNVDIERLSSALARIGLELPIEIAGDVTVQFKVSVPLNGLNQARAYRFEGTLSSPRLRLDALTLGDFTTDVRYADGVLELPQLTASGNGRIFNGDFGFQTVSELNSQTTWQNVLQDARVFRPCLPVQQERIRREPRSGERMQLWA